MSQKYKNFSKTSGSDSNSVLPPDVVRVGYLRKLKKMKRRFFVLYLETESTDARLEYYSSEKKWRSGGEPRRSILLKKCLNISRKLHAKQKNVLALYTQDDCFSVVTETPEELDLWLDDMLGIQKSLLYSNENRFRFIFDRLWQVEIDKHDLVNSGNENLTGPFRVALSSKSLTLIKMDSSNDFVYLEFPLMSIRRCGHSKDHFFIELGRSASTGAGEIYMATEGTIIAQNMHETVLSAMKSSKVREDGIPVPRPRSASTSENSNPGNTRRPVGVVAPQVASSASSNTLSNSREKCDSLPPRPKTLSEIPHNCVFNALSSPHSSGIPCRRLSSRPHSMYEWPSFNSPSAKITSPFSLSSSGGFASSSEEVDCIRQSSSFYSQTKSSDGTLCSDCPLTEIPDEYLKMSPSEELKPETSGSYMVMTQTDKTSNVASYVDMKSKKTESDIGISFIKKIDSYMSMSPAAGNQELILATQDGYLDMSPSLKSFPKSSDGVKSVQANENKSHDGHNLKDGDNGQFLLEKVPSLLKSSEENCKIKSLKDSNISAVSPEQKTLQELNSSTFIDNKFQIVENKSLLIKPPIPERTYKNENRNLYCPPIPIRKNEFQKNANIVQHNKSENFNCKLKHSQKQLSKKMIDDEDLSQCMQIEENSVFDDNEVFTKSNIQVNPDPVNKISPTDQNTNFSCLIHNDKSVTNSLPCASMCSAHQNSFKQVTTNSHIEQNQNQSVLKHADSTKKLIGLQDMSQTCKNTENLIHNKNSVSNTSHTLPKSHNHVFPKKNDSVGRSCGDYVNLEFKKGGSSTILQSSNSTVAFKNIQSLPEPPVETNYSNIQFGKPFCPTPNPIPATCDISFSSMKSDKTLKSSEQNVTPSLNNNSIFAVPENVRIAKVHHTNSSGDMCVMMPGKMRNIPNTLPAFRKQMSAPAAPPSLRPELPSPGRKSSCPVTASASMIKSPLPSSTCVRPAMYLQGSTAGHLRVSTSRSPDHSSISSISSASDEVSSNHSSPKTSNVLQNCGGIVSYSTSSDLHYENVVIPQRPVVSRPSSVSSEKELNYASLDLTPSTRDEVPRSPTIVKSSNVENAETLLYAQIDFTKSEELKSFSEQNLQRREQEEKEKNAKTQEHSEKDKKC